MKRALLLFGLLAQGLLAQTLPEQKQMRQILANIAKNRPQAEKQIDWENLQIPKARDLPDYGRLSANEQSAFRKAVLNTLRPLRQDLKVGPGLILEGPGVQYRFRQTPQGLKLSGIF